MGKSPEYRAVSNFFRNTQKITRDEIKTIVREVIKDMVPELVERFCKSSEWRRICEQHLKFNMYHVQDHIARYVLDELITTKVNYLKRTQEGK